MPKKQSQKKSEPKNPWDKPRSQIVLRDVNPKKNPAFSPNLYSWLRKNSRMMASAEMYEMDGAKFLGFIDGDYLIGSKLMPILCHGARAPVFAYVRKECKLVPFWSEYLRLGRCSIDPDHSMSFIDERFSVQGDIRTCMWCGKKQKLFRTVRQSKVVDEEWEDLGKRTKRASRQRSDTQRVLKMMQTAERFFAARKGERCSLFCGRIPPKQRKLAASIIRQAGRIDESNL